MCSDVLCVVDIKFRRMKEFIVSKKRKSEEEVDAPVVVPNPYLAEVKKLRRTIPQWDDFFDEGTDEDRANNWVRLEVLGEPLCEKYAWAIPNQRALNIIASFSPIIEIGAGKGYWGSLLRAMGTDIECYDKNKTRKGNWLNVGVGGPNVLKDPKHVDRTLFLCYPDDSNGMAMKCLENYSGEYIIHVGELITTGTKSGGIQAPFGRTTGSDFSVALATSFHCLLTASLPRFPFSKDCITVWKRTVFVPGKSALLGDDDSTDDVQESTNKKQSKKQKQEESEDEEEDGEGSDNEESDEEDEDCWASIPYEERLPEDRAAPCLAHLLKR